MKLGERISIERHHAHATNWPGYRYGYNNLTQPHVMEACLQCQNAAAAILAIFGIRRAEPMAALTARHWEESKRTSNGDTLQMLAHAQALAISAVLEASIGIIDGMIVAQSFIETFEDGIAQELVARVMKN